MSKVELWSKHLALSSLMLLYQWAVITWSVRGHSISSISCSIVLNCSEYFQSPWSIRALSVMTRITASEHLSHENAVLRFCKMKQDETLRIIRCTLVLLERWCEPGARCCCCHKEPPAAPAAPAPPAAPFCPVYSAIFLTLHLTAFCSNIFTFLHSSASPQCTTVTLIYLEVGFIVKNLNSLSPVSLKTRKNTNFSNLWCI